MKVTLDAPEPPFAAAPKVVRLIAALIRSWAYLGGILLLVITGLEAVNALAKLITGSAHAAEHELVKYMVGIAVFTFLPWCQLMQGHIAVDIFTQKISEPLKHGLAALGAIVGGAIAVLLLRQMSLGMQSYIEFREVTPVLGLPIWTAFPFVLISLSLWLLACLLSLSSHIRALRLSLQGG